MSKGKKEKGKPEIVVLYCAQSVSEPPKNPIEQVDGTKLVMMPCSSKVESYQVLEILAKGADGVEVVACAGKSCRFLVGNERAEKRMARLGKMLDEAGVGAARAGITRASKLTVSDLLKIASKRAESLKSLGSNPIKGE